MDAWAMMALGIYLWAGLWVGWLALAAQHRKPTGPTWVQPVAFMLLLLLWWIILPLHVRKLERLSVQSREFAETMRSVADAIAEAKRAKKESNTTNE